MANDHVIHALVRKYAELAGQLQKAEAERARIAEALNHVRATVLIFQPGYRIKAILPKRPKKPSSYGRHGALMRAILEALRTATAGMTARDLAEAVLASRGVLDPDERRLKLTIRAVNIALASLAKRNVVASDGDTPRRWSLLSAP
jgi:hypothetical protein